MTVQVTERERLIVTLAAYGIGAISVLELFAMLWGIDGTCFAAALAAVTGIVCSVGGILFGKSLKQ
jgi:hypothetical protein